MLPDPSPMTLLEIIEQYTPESIKRIIAEATGEGIPDGSNSHSR